MAKHLRSFCASINQLVDCENLGGNFILEAMPKLKPRFRKSPSVVQSGSVLVREALGGHSLAPVATDRYRSALPGLLARAGGILRLFAEQRGIGAEKLDLARKVIRSRFVTHRHPETERT